jgi:myo-inositol 2-dehydrogenase/D-chiro-inositol 1-dehydrogenase
MQRALPDGPFDARNPLRVGIVGSGMMGFEHIRNLRLQPDMQLVALADPNPPSRLLGRRATDHPVAEYEDARGMLDAESLDAVIIATPNFTHAAVLDELLDRPIDLLVEKPLCTTLEDCDRIVRAAENRSRVTWVGMEYRFMPPVERLIQEIEADRAGQLRMLAIREHRYPFLKKVGDWNRFNRNTGGTLVEKCCHFFDLMNLIVGSAPERVYASGGQDVNHLDERYDGQVPDILDNAYVIVDYAGGVRALLDLCMFAEASRNEQEICATGDLGKVECFIPESRVVIGLREGREMTEIPIEVPQEILEAGFHHGATWYQQRAFLDAILDPEAPVIDVHAGRAAVALGVAAQRSIETGAPIAMSDLER